MQIDIFSDTICPWCFIGKKRLERAMAERPQEDLTIRWRTFQLNPGMAREGMDRQSYLATKFGGREGAERVYNAIADAGASEGIDFKFDEIARTPNTILSHRLIRWSFEKDLQNEVLDRLFAAYFLEGQDIGDLDRLVALACEVGLEAAETRAFLESDLYREDVEAEDAQARQAGVTGVPCFIYAGRYALTGAQPPAAHFQLLDLMRQEEQEAAKA